MYNVSFTRPLQLPTETEIVQVRGTEYVSMETQYHGYLSYNTVYIMYVNVHVLIRLAGSQVFPMVYKQAKKIPLPHLCMPLTVIVQNDHLSLYMATV